MIFKQRLQRHHVVAVVAPFRLVLLCAAADLLHRTHLVCLGMWLALPGVGTAQSPDGLCRAGLQYGGAVLSMMCTCCPRGPVQLP